MNKFFDELEFYRRRNKNEAIFKWMKMYYEAQGKKVVIIRYE